MYMKYFYKSLHKCCSFQNTTFLVRVTKAHGSNRERSCFPNPSTRSLTEGLWFLSAVFGKVAKPIARISYFLGWKTMATMAKGQLAIRIHSQYKMATIWKNMATIVRKSNKVRKLHEKYQVLFWNHFSMKPLLLKLKPLRIRSNGIKNSKMKYFKATLNSGTNVN